jgi:ParB family transcriptional regulator, chromosome partitioning protein
MTPPPRDRASLSSLGGDPFEGFNPDDSSAVDALTSTEGRFLEIPLEKLSPNPEQPRQHFDEQELRELAESIKANGLLQPIVVEPGGGDGFVILVGERRFRAAKVAGLRKIQAFVRTKGSDRLMLAIIENAQRENLNPIEDAEALQKLSGRGYSNQDIARLLSKSEPTVSELLSLNRLPDDVKGEIRTGSVELPKSTLVLIAQAGSEAAQRELWRRAKGGTTVREIRRLARPKRRSDGRAKRYSHRYTHPQKAYEVEVRFRKSRASSEEVREALQAALKELRP